MTESVTVEQVNGAVAAASWKPDPAKKVAIVGFASSSRDQAGNLPDDWGERWLLNHLYNSFPSYVKRNGKDVPWWHRWFEIHPQELFTSDVVREGVVQDGKGHWEWLKSQPGPDQPGFRPVYMQDHYDAIPASVKFQKDEINAFLSARFGFPPDYFTSSISHMLALAIMEGFGEIHVYGVDLLQDEEYAYQRPGSEYLIGIAQGAGIKVHIPEQSALLKANYVYGYSEPRTDLEREMPFIKFVDSVAAKCANARDRAQATLQALGGGIEVLGMLRDAMGKTPPQNATDMVVLITNLEKDLRNKQEAQSKNHTSAEAQRAAFECCTTWKKHEARGGELRA